MGDQRHLFYLILGSKDGGEASYYLLFALGSHVFFLRGQQDTTPLDH